MAHTPGDARTSDDDSRPAGLLRRVRSVDRRAVWGGLAAAVSIVVVVALTSVAVLIEGVGSVQRVPIVPVTDEQGGGASPGGEESAGGVAVDPATGGSATRDDVAPVTDRTTVLVVGSDSRAGMSEEELAAVGTEDHGSDLDDTLMLVQLDPDEEHLRMLSLPRDLWVEHCDGRSGRINEAALTGEAALGPGMGPSCLVATVEAATGIDIDHYVRLDLAGFVHAVDAVGGVTFHVDQPLRDAASGLDVEAGCVDFDGVTAVQFVRARDLDSDLGRIARQQRFVTELLDEVASVGTLANPARLRALVGSIADSLETDEDLGVREMLALATALREVSASDADAVTLPVADAVVDGQQVLVPIEAQVEAATEPFRGDATEPSRTEAAEEAAPGTAATAPVGDDTANKPGPTGGDGLDGSEPGDEDDAAVAPAADEPDFAGAATSDTTC